MGWPFKDGQDWSKFEGCEEGAGGNAEIKESWKLIDMESPGGNERECDGGRGVSLKEKTRMGQDNLITHLTICSISVLLLLLLCFHYPISSKTVLGKAGHHIWVPLKLSENPHIGDSSSPVFKDWILGPIEAMPIHSIHKLRGMPPTFPVFI